MRDQKRKRKFKSDEQDLFLRERREKRTLQRL